MICQGMGVPTKENKFMFSLRYADDQVIIAQDAGDIKFILKKLNTTYKEWGLAIDFNKTEFIADQ
jgi:Reverse transcriptase (RNA-dependent DNA polymerase).